MAYKENYVQAQILAYLHFKKIFAWRNNNTGIYDAKRGSYRCFRGLLGVSDILGILPNGRFLAIECKTKTGKTSIHQENFMHNINQHGGLAFVARSVEDVQAKGL